MAYFNRKALVQILAEKPDMMHAFPECVLSAARLEEMALIPDIALCDITMLAEPAALERLCATARPDAVVPAVAYNGIERMRWSAFDAAVPVLKKRLERSMQVHMLPPVVLGAPAFRSALCMYADRQSQRASGDNLLCAACIFYRAAVYIPLCKLCAASTLFLTGCAPCCDQAADLMHAAGLVKYCKILLAGYGIELFIDLCAQPAVRVAEPDDDEAAAPAFECFAHVPCSVDRAQAGIPEEQLQRYFEHFAIPYAANVMSALLAGREVDFIETARTFLPADRRR